MNKAKTAVPLKVIGRMALDAGIKAMKNSGKVQQMKEGKSAMRNKEKGKIGWVLLRLLGIPIPILWGYFFPAGVPLKQLRCNRCPNAILSDKGEKALLKEDAEIDFVRAEFSHLKAIPGDHGDQMLLKKANAGQSACILDVYDKAVFIAAARMCQWELEKDRSGNLAAIQLR